MLIAMMQNGKFCKKKEISDCELKRINDAEKEEST